MNHKILIATLLAYLFVMHLTLLVELSIDSYDLMISIGLVIISGYVYLTSQILNNKWITIISCIIMAGSISNFIDELFGRNNYLTSGNYIGETIVWIILIIILLKRRLKDYVR